MYIIKVKIKEEFAKEHPEKEIPPEVNVLHAEDFDKLNARIFGFCHDNPVMIDLYKNGALSISIHKIEELSFVENFTGNLDTPSTEIH